MNSFFIFSTSKILIQNNYSFIKFSFQDINTDYIPLLDVKSYFIDTLMFKNLRKIQKKNYELINVRIYLLHMFE